MSGRDFQLLMLYADGELDPIKRRQVEVLLEQDAEARRFVCSLREQREVIDTAFNEAEAPDLSRLTQHVDRAFAKRRLHNKSRFQGTVAWPVALAASIAIGMIAFGGGYMAGVNQFQTTVDNLSSVLRRDQKMTIGLLSRALESYESGQTLMWSSGRTEIEITPVRTFRSASGKWCREYDWRISEADVIQMMNGVACRENGGEWRRTFERPHDI